ncbi:MAG: hypothetical protein CEE42_04795 [Promethearchaeota archaeon Loki_b31]|nr:MAG: hypothetical protein CEE42_04795 [Candidatus Lokiarchaeota archaeon Loki_b31]
MKRHIQVSLVIPTYNRLMKLFRLLKSLNRLTPLPDEVIIIDDHSTDQTPELLKRWKDLGNGICKKIVLKDQNKGPAHSRNIGIELASNKLVAFIDDDVVIKSDWVEKITAPLSNAHKSLVGVGGVVNAFKKHIISQYYVIHNILEAPIQLNYLPTVNCFFKKEHLMEVGGFDDNFLFAGGEDTDLCLRLKKRGFFFDKVQDAIVYHDFSPNFIDFCHTWLRYGKGTHLAIHNLRRDSLD